MDSSIKIYKENDEYTWVDWQMKVLVACEYSGVVREAFRKRGHDAWSCDILPADDHSLYHYQCDVFDPRNGPFAKFANRKWDLMIAHPPCTYLCNSGVGWLSKPRNYDRWKELKKAIKFFLALKNSDIPKIAIENPIPHKYARDGYIDVNFIKGIGKYTQIIQPYQFGHPERKATCLWLKGLPKLVPTDIVKLPMDKKKAQRLHWLPPSKDRWKIRSRTFEGIAKAMAEQWG